jgi:hypothetical protein
MVAPANKGGKAAGGKGKSGKEEKSVDETVRKKTFIFSFYYP